MSAKTPCRELSGRAFEAVKKYYFLTKESA